MSAEPSFSDQPVGSPVAPCRAPKKAPAPPWTVDCVLKILCPKDKHVVGQLSKTKVNVADKIYFDDPYYDGKKWTTKRFDAGGVSSASNKEIGVMSGASCEDAATTFYHEIWHQNQSSAMNFEQKEYEAYYETEKWTIERGLPSQSAGTKLRKKEKGKVVPDRKAIEKYVHDNYPVPKKTSGPPPPRPVGRDAAGNTKMSDGTSRPPKKGDTYPGPQQVVNQKTLPGSVWKCP